MHYLKTVSGLALSLTAALMVSGCATETAVQELLGSGKSNSPDEAQVTVAQNLAMPPDLQLRAPPDGPSNDNQAGVAPPPPPPPIQPAPAATEPAAVQSAPRPVTGSTPAAPRTREDVYKRYGISLTYPDGKPKPPLVLDDELRDAQLAEKRKINPNYGSIWNMGGVWGD